MKVNLKKGSGQEKCHIGVNVYEDIRTSLEELASQNGLTLSQVMRTAINDLLDKEQ